MLGSKRPVYVDVHDLPLDLRTDSGAQPIAHLVDLMRKRGLRPIPVTGTESERGIDYLNTIRALVAGKSDGVCVRLERDELNEPKLLRTSLSSTLHVLALDPAEVDMVLDFRYVGQDRVDVLRATVLEALRAIHDIGSFRNLAIAGGSVPEQLTKRDNGKVRREARVEFEFGSQIIATVAGRAPIAFGDFGIVSPHYVPPAKIVNPPARIRYTTPCDHVFFRAKRKDYQELCRQLIESSDYLDIDDPAFSMGDQRIALAAKGQAGPGSPAIWVGNDTNHHLEVVSAQAWGALQQQSLDSRFAIPEPSHHPWLQPELL